VAYTHADDVLDQVGMSEIERAGERVEPHVAGEVPQQREPHVNERTLAVSLDGELNYTRIALLSEYAIRCV
jgi:hypothetical protein